LAITMMTSGEKSEHLIYTILPLSIAFYFLVQWEITSLSLALASLAASFLALLLFELSLDEIFVKELFRRRSGDKFDYQKRRILLWNMFLRPWEYEKSTYNAKNDAKKLEKEISHISEVTVSSSLISPRLWRLRAEIYLLISILPLVATLTIVLNKLVLSPPMVASVWFPVIQQLAGTFNVCGIILSPVLIIILLVAISYRHRHLGKNIRYLAQFRYLERNLALARMNTRNTTTSPTDGDWASTFKKRTENVWAEIKLQLDILKARDWIFFIDRSSRWGREMSKEITDEIEAKGLAELTDPWAELAIPKNAETEESWKKLVWTHYYFEKLVEYGTTHSGSREDDAYPKLDDSAKKLIKLIGEKIKKGCDDFTRPDDLLDFIITIPLDSQASLPILRGISERKSDVEKSATTGLATLLTAFNKRNNTPFDRGLAAKAIIHIFNGEVSEGNEFWGDGDSPYIRLSNIIKTVGCKVNGFDKVVRHCIQQSPGLSLMKISQDTDVSDCIINLGLKDILEERMGKTGVP